MFKKKLLHGTLIPRLSNIYSWTTLNEILSICTIPTALTDQQFFQFVIDASIP